MVACDDDFMASRETAPPAPIIEPAAAPPATMTGVAAPYVIAETQMPTAMKKKPPATATHRPSNRSCSQKATSNADPLDLRCASYFSLVMMVVMMVRG